MSPRTAFEQELRELKESVAAMSYQVEHACEDLFAAFYKKDQGRLSELRKSDQRISQMERNIESRCLFLITKQQPVARDLRIITASLKVVTDIRRVGDHVSDIAELLLRLDRNPVKEYSSHLSDMANSAREMLRASVNAFVSRDTQAAQRVIESDDIVDNLFNQVKGDLIQSLRRETGSADECVDVLMLAKYLEKIGDHAVNIANWELFQETGNMEDARLL